MTVKIVDIGDPSVGMADLLTAKVEIDESMEDVLWNDGTVKQFGEELKALVEKYCAAENKYEVEYDVETHKKLYPYWEEM